MKIQIQNTSEEVEKILKQDHRFLTEDNKLIKSEIIEKVITLDTGLIKLLTKNARTLSLYFKDIEGTLVFDKQKFLDFVNSNEFLPKSYTAFENQLGLSGDNRKLMVDSHEVVLNFPYKDCILEGGQEKTDEKRDEIFYNSILAPDEIDKLKAPKALVNWKMYDEKGSHDIKDLSNKNNLIIRGNNLFGLYSLLPKYRGQVKLIYIDPPYNTGTDDFRYNDKFNHSTWLVFMKNRLEVARELLSADGSIFVQCDDNEQAYLKVLMDEVFTRDNYLNTISIKTKASSGASGGGEDKRIKKNTEYVIVYQASEAFEGFNDIYSDKPLKDYIDERKEASKNFAYKTVFVGDIKKTYLKTIKSGRGDDIKLYKINNPKFSSVSKIAKEEKCEQNEVYEKYFEKIFTLENAQTSIRGRVLDAVGIDEDYYVAEYVPVSGKNKGNVTEVIFGGKTKRLLSWLKNVAYKDSKGELIKRDKVGTLWDDLSWSSVSIEGGVTLESGKKPEALIERIIEMSTKKNDLVLDYHLGSGTTCAVAHKMERKYIGIEQLDYGDDDSTVRIQNVIKGDNTGVSSSVNWKGGGSFVYAEILQWNEKYVQRVNEAKTGKDLEKIYKDMQKEAFFRYDISLEKFKDDKTQKAFAELSITDQKQVLVDCLDTNHLYVNFNDIEDSVYKVDKKDIELNKKFYK